jgi:hypothetical protein
VWFSVKRTTPYHTFPMTLMSTCVLCQSHDGPIEICINPRTPCFLLPAGLHSPPEHLLCGSAPYPVEATALKRNITQSCMQATQLDQLNPQLADAVADLHVLCISPHLPSNSAKGHAALMLLTQSVGVVAAAVCSRHFGLPAGCSLHYEQCQQLPPMSCKLPSTAAGPTFCHLSP